MTPKARRARSAGWLVGALVLLALLAPAAAAAGWSPVTTLTSPGENTEFPTVAADANRDVVAAWYQGGDDPHRLIARLSDDGGASWGPRQDLGSAILGEGPVRPDLLHAAVGAGGKATVVWQQRRGGYQRIVEAQARNERFGNTEAVSPAGVDSAYPDLAVAGSGRVVIVWATDDSVQRVIVSRHGSLRHQGHPRQIVAPGSTRGRRQP